MLASLDTLLTSKYWQIYSLALAYFTMVFFTCAPSVMISSELELPFAYQLKADNPLADTAAVFMDPKDGESFHGYKLSPRILGSSLLWAAQALNLHPYLPASIFGLLYLLSGIIVSYQITQNKRIAFFMGLLFAGLPAASASFAVTWMPKPFDGIAIGLVALSILVRKQPYFLLASGFLACWTDERSILGLFYLMVLSLIESKKQPRDQLSKLAIIPLSILLYAISRLFLSHLLEWKSPDTSYMLLDLPSWLGFAQLAAWVPFEGSWILIISALAAGTSRHIRLLLSSLVILPVLTIFLALDLTRNAAFCFPAIFIFLYTLWQSKQQEKVPQMAALAATLTLLSPNLEVIVNSIVRWIPSLLYPAS
jgi:hypothetical protein